MRNKKFLMILFALLLIVTLSGCQKQDDTEILKLKVNEEIQYLDTNIISMLNKLNNISFENYYVTTENIKLTDASQSSSTSKEEKSKQSESSSGGEKSSSGGGESQSEGTDSSGQNTSITVNDMKSNNILLGDRNNIDWNSLKSEIENLCSSWNAIIIDLYKLGINNNDILKFSNFLDDAVTNIKQENRSGALVSTANLYNILPIFLDSYSDDRSKINIKWTKAHVVNAYSIMGTDNWDPIVKEINQADQSYSAVMSDIDFVNQKSYNVNKTYVTLKELQNSIDVHDVDIFYIKYKNFMEEVNLL